MTPVAVCRSCDNHAVHVPDRHSAALLLRVWRDDADSLRGRLLLSGGGQESIAVAEGVDDICAALRSWLKTL